MSRPARTRSTPVGTSYGRSIMAGRSGKRLRQKRHRSSFGWHRFVPQGVLLAATVVGLVLASAASASASIALGGDEAFKAHVRHCFELFQEDPQASAILADLMRPQGPHSHKTTILPRAVADPANPGPN